MTTGARRSRKGTGTGRAVRRRKTTRKATAGRKRTAATRTPKGRPARKTVRKKVTSRKARTAKKGAARKAPARRQGAVRKVARKTTARRPSRKKPAGKKTAKKARVQKTLRTAAPRQPTQRPAPVDARQIGELEDRIRELEGELLRAQEQAREAHGQLEELRAQVAQAAPPATEPLGDVPAAWQSPAGIMTNDEDVFDDDLTDTPGLVTGPDEVLASGEGFTAVEADGPDESPFDEDITYEDYDDEESFLSSMSGTAQRRRELDRERADRELELGDESFWLICPKCGEYLTEHEFDNIKVERCESCGVVTLDKGEIELLLSSEEDRAVAYRVKGLLQ